jgi:hypothetical protein
MMSLSSALMASEGSLLSLVPKKAVLDSRSRTILYNIYIYILHDGKSINYQLNIIKGTQIE